MLIPTLALVSSNFYNDSCISYIPLVLSETPPAVDSASASCGSSLSTHLWWTMWLPACMRSCTDASFRNHILICYLLFPALFLWLTLELAAPLGLMCFLLVSRSSWICPNSSRISRNMRLHSFHPSCSHCHQLAHSIWSLPLPVAPSRLSPLSLAMEGFPALWSFIGDLTSC